ncbi:hypothetical protein [Aeromonas sp. CU5]|nr:hypothetical protein [Aeromonas sp. CU5]
MRTALLLLHILDTLATNPPVHNLCFALAVLAIAILINAIAE